MAERLVDQFAEATVRDIGRMLAAAGSFDQRRFVRSVCDEQFATLGLMQRALRMAQAMQTQLPDHYPHALAQLLRAIGPPLTRTDELGMTPFLYLPHTLWVANYGLEHFDLSMAALHALTQRFTAEFAIRPFIERYPQQTFGVLRQWSTDASPHVRRLVSEGTRPRLPWASRLPALQRDPTLNLALLERLKDDPELYVRRSVANHLSDIGKDHPELLRQIARRWLNKASAERRWIVEHALRFAVKRGDGSALALLGFGQAAAVQLRTPKIAPRQPLRGGAVNISVTVDNTQRRAQPLMIDLRVFYVKANGRSTPKVFKLKRGTLAAGGSWSLSKTLSLRELSTRRHYPGVHRVELLINGASQPLGKFKLR